MNTFFTGLTWTLAVVSSPGIGKSDLSFQELSSGELDGMYKNGSLKKHYNTLIQTIAEERRVGEIYRFDCACLLIRQLPMPEYVVAKKFIFGYDCPTTWEIYITESPRPTAVQLREVLTSSNYFIFGMALCNARSRCHKHIHDDHETVQVISQLRKGTTDSIVEILEKEQPQFLLTSSEMQYVNTFAKASDEAPFPFFEFLKYKRRYAVPQIRSPHDMKKCPGYLGDN